MDKLKKAVEYFNGDLRCNDFTEEHIKSLVNLATRYLALEGFPEEKQVYKDSVQWSSKNHHNIVANQAIKDCKLAHMKIIEERCKKVEEIVKVGIQFEVVNNETPYTYQEASKHIAEAITNLMKGDL